MIIGFQCQPFVETSDKASPSKVLRCKYPKIVFILCLHRVRTEGTSMLRSNNTHSRPYIYIYHIYMITSQNSIRNISVTTDEEPSPILALSEGGSRRNMES